MTSLASRLALLPMLVCCVIAACGEDTGRDATDSGLRDAMADPGPSSDQAACYAAARATDAGLSDAAKCVCDTCLAEITACNEDAPCSEIRACMLKTACTITSCYVGDGLCRDVIDKWSAMSLSFALAQRIDECSTAMGCNAPGPMSCSSVATFECDGNEDCAGRMCCARFDGARYDRSICADTCSTLAKGDAGATAQWSELCHPGDACKDPSYRCLASEFLPAFLYRCRDVGAEPDAGPPGAAGRVICGTRSCGAAEKCCVREPKKPYCAPLEDDCMCSPTNLKDAGPRDAGDGTDSGSADAG